MKKRWMLLFVIVLVLAACSEPAKDEPKDVSEKENKTEAKDNEQENEEIDKEEDAPDESSEEEKEDQTTKIEKNDDAVEDEQTTTDTADKEDTSNDEIEQQDDVDEADELSEQEILDLNYRIFDAQVEEDYNYLESVLSKGSTLNKENNTIQFDDVTYPHEFEFISKKDREFLDERYIQGPEDGTLIVGFAVTDYTNESSYVIDVQFIKENGKWKLNDMDINK